METLLQEIQLNVTYHSVMKIHSSWDIIAHSLVNSYQHFGGA